MSKEDIIFLGIIDNSKDFYSIFKEEINIDIQILCEDIIPYGIITITEEEIKNYFGDYKDIKKLRETAIKYFAENIQGQTFDIGEYKNIRISKTSKNKYRGFSADERKLLIVPKLLDILKSSKYVRTSDKYKKRRDNIIMFYYFTNKVLIRNKEYKVFITIGKDNRGKLFYDLDENKSFKALPPLQTTGL